MLEIKKLTGGYVHVPVLKDVSFTVESGQLVASFCKVKPLILIEPL